MDRDTKWAAEQWSDAVLQRAKLGKNLERACVASK